MNKINKLRGNFHGIYKYCHHILTELASKINSIFIFILNNEIAAFANIHLQSALFMLNKFQHLIKVTSYSRRTRFSISQFQAHDIENLKFNLIILYLQRILAYLLYVTIYSNIKFVLIYV